MHRKSELIDDTVREKKQRREKYKIGIVETMEFLCRCGGVHDQLYADKRKYATIIMNLFVYLLI